MEERLLNDQSQKIRSAAQSALDKFNAIMIERKIARKLEEEYEEMFGIDPEDDEFLEEDDEEMEMSLRDLDKLDGNDQNEYLLDDEGLSDELPF
jgi:hypothetical protein